MSEISNYDKVQNALKILNKKEINENDDSRSVCNTLSDGWMQENEGSGSGKSKTVQSEKSQIMEAVHIKEEALMENGDTSTQEDPDDGEDLFDASMVPSDDTGTDSAEDPKAEPKAEPESNEGKGDDGGKGDDDGKGNGGDGGKGSNEGPSSDKNGDGDVDNYNNAQAATMVKALFDVILAAANADLKAQVKVDNGANGGNAGTGSTETEVNLNNSNGAANQAATPDANANSTDTPTNDEVPTETPKE